MAENTDCTMLTLRVCVIHTNTNKVCNSAACYSTSNKANKPLHNVTWTDRTNLPLISVSFENFCFDALIDTGSQIPLLCSSIYDKIPNPHFSANQIDAFGCDGGKLDILGVVSGELRFHRYDSPIKAEFYILKNSSQKAILPHCWLRLLKAQAQVRSLMKFQ